MQTNSNTNLKCVYIEMWINVNAGGNENAIQIPFRTTFCMRIWYRKEWMRKNDTIFSALIKWNRALAWTSTAISVIIGCLLRQNVCIYMATFFFTSIEVCCFSLWIFYDFTPALYCICKNIFFAFQLCNLFIFFSFAFILHSVARKKFLCSWNIHDVQIWKMVGISFWLNKILILYAMAPETCKYSHCSME